MEFYSNGKLLLTGEYVILNGALSLALPTIYGQYLKVKNNSSNKIKWISYDNNEKIWFNCEFDKDNLEVIFSSSDKISDRLKKIISCIRIVNTDFLKLNGSEIITKLTFNKNWGLGSSSTLINNLAEFAKIDPYFLNDKIFKGSGYDIACAKSNTSLLYKIHGNKRTVKKINFDPPFKDKLYLVYLNKKTNSLEEIKKFKKIKNQKMYIEEISNITSQIISCNNQIEFNSLIKEHENIISKLTARETVKNILFSDFKGEIKSLGAWGGDFILASSSELTTDYFRNKGFNHIFKYNELIMNQ